MQLLHDGFAVHLKSGFQPLAEALFIGGFAHPYRGTGVGGLDEHGVVELLPEHGLGGVEVGELPLFYSVPFGGADAVVIQNGMGHLFVHADSTGTDIAAHIGDAGQFQQALDGAVLPVFAVEDRKDRIHREDGGLPIPDFHNAVDRPVRGKKSLGDILRLLPFVFGDPVDRAGIAEPAAFFGDAQHNDVKRFMVNVAKGKPRLRTPEGADLYSVLAPPNTTATVIFFMVNSSLLCIPAGPGR